MHVFLLVGLSGDSYYSNNGGVTWIKRYNYAYRFSFADSLHGAATYPIEKDTVNVAGLRSPWILWHVKFTSDGGKSWITDVNDKNAGYGKYYLYTYTGATYWNNSGGVYLQCVDSLRTTVAGAGGYIGHTSDGAVTWHQQVSNTLNNLYGVC